MLALRGKVRAGAVSARREPRRCLRSFINERRTSDIMLVLSRQRDESIVIGDNVIVTIVDVRGDRVRLGIEAPREVSVHRREVYDAIQRENQQASQIQPDQARRISEGASGAS
jgi:carbon storage regulator